MKRDIAFSSGGWLGIVNDDFTEQNVVRVAQAFVRYFFQSRRAPATFKVTVGYDGRKNSRDHASLAAKILAENGIEVLLSSGVVPTPVLSFATRHNGCTIGLMVTGGHHPPEFNGIEFKGAYGGPLLSEETANVEGLLSDVTEERVSPSSSSRKEITQVDFLPDYFSHLETIIDFSALRSFAENPKNTANVLIDSMGGAGQTIIEDILVRCGWRAQTLFGEPEDLFFDRWPEPVSENLDALKYNVKVIDTQFGVATDGSGIQCSIVCNDGECMNMQETILALLWHLHDQKHYGGNILKSASTTDRVKQLSDEWKIPLFDIGFENGVEKMMVDECLLGVVGRGGFCFGKILPDCDGILSGLFFAEMVAISKKPLHEIIKRIRNLAGQVHYRSVDIRCDVGSAKRLIRDMADSPPKHLVRKGMGKVSVYESRGAIKGIKYEWGDCRWLLIELLPLQSLVRLHSEANSEDEVLTFLDYGKKCFEF